MENAIVAYDRLCKAVAEVGSVDEAKDYMSAADEMRFRARQAENRDLEAKAVEIRVRAERRIGELMAAQKEAGLLDVGGRPKTGFSNNPVSETEPITLAEAGIDKNLAHRARKFASIPEEEFEDRLDVWHKNIRAEVDRRVTLDVFNSKPHRTIGTGVNEWYTPTEYIDLARRVLGSIDLDPASSEIANRVVGANQIYTIEDNGLEKPWHGRVWMNPPYSQPEIAHFASKIVGELRNIEAAIVLTHNFTDTRWFHEMASAATALCFTKGRIGYVSPDGEIAQPTNGQTFFYFGREYQTFREVFSQIGLVVKI